MNMREILSASILLASLLLTGCGGFNGADEAYQDPEYRHPISVQPDVTTLPIFASRGGLTAADRESISSFATAYKSRGHGPLTVATPSGSYQANREVSTLVEVRDVLAEKGITGDSLAFAPYDASSQDSNAPIILSYKRFVAHASPCGDWSTDYAYDPANGTPPNFGCATQHNLAALVADPADLVAPRDMPPSDATRRSVVYDKYRKGEPTGATRDASDSGAVSEVGR